ncbi:MAG: DUF3052 family protein [Myxococcales bacterium]|nr:DUF3052 family protein [Myxococcales bacterium]
MAGYSGTPLAKKLGIKPGHAVVVLGKEPASFATKVEVPEGARVFRQLRQGPIDVLVYFVDRVTELERRFAVLTSRMHPDGGLWIAWPKKASKRPTDITEDVVRRIGLAGGLVDNKVCAIDDVWSGLRLVVRVENRAAVAYRAEPPLSVRQRRATNAGGASGSSGRRAEARR